MSIRRSPRWSVILAVLAVAVILIGVVQNTPRSPSHAPLSITYDYTCCRSNLVNATHHPGDTIELRWIRTSRLAPRTGAVTLSLSASVTGPFASASALKAASARRHPRPGSVNVTAHPVNVSNVTPASPVSSIRLPQTARAGYYELTITEKDLLNSSGSWTVTTTAKTILRVAPRS